MTKSQGFELTIWIYMYQLGDNILAGRTKEVIRWIKSPTLQSDVLWSVGFLGSEADLYDGSDKNDDNIAAVCWRKDLVSLARSD